MHRLCVAVEAQAQVEKAADGGDGGADDNDGEMLRQRRGERKTPKVISPSDPSSAWTGALRPARAAM